MVDQNYDALSARIDTLQNCVKSISDRVDRAEQNITTSMKQVGIMETVLQGNITVQEKLSTTIANFEKVLGDFRVTLAEIRMSIQNQAEKIGDLSKKVSGVEKSAESLRERGHFDFIQWMRANFITIILGIGSVWAIIQAIIDALK